MSLKIGAGESCVIGKQACFQIKSWLDHLIKSLKTYAEFTGEFKIELLVRSYLLK